MADETVRVKGLKELQKALQDYDKDLAKELRVELKDAGGIVQRAASSLFSPISPRSAAGYKVRVRRGSVGVEQSLRRTTGLRPHYGALQMRTALLPALQSKEDEVLGRLDNMLDTIGRQNGF